MKILCFLLGLMLITNTNAVAATSPAFTIDPVPQIHPAHQKKVQKLNFLQKLKVKMALKLIKHTIRKAEAGKSTKLPLFAFIASLIGGVLFVVVSPLALLFLPLGLILALVALGKDNLTKTDKTLAIIAIIIPLAAVLFLLFALIIWTSGGFW